MTSNRKWISGAYTTLTLLFVVSISGVVNAQEPTSRRTEQPHLALQTASGDGVSDDETPIQPRTINETQTTDASFDVCPVSNVVQAFNGIPAEGGSALAFSYYQNVGLFMGDDPTWCQHYQGVVRKDYNGVPYFIFSRSGNKTGTCELPGFKNLPAELLVVAMYADNDSAGESLGESCEQIVDGKCQPRKDLGLYRNRTVLSIHLNGVSGWPAWMHAGGMQLVGDILVIPVEKACDLQDDGTCKDGPAEGALLFVDVSNPESPRLLKEIKTYKGMGVVAVTKSPDTDTFLFMVSGGEFDKDSYYWIYESNTGNLTDPELALNRIGEWHKDNVKQGSCQDDPWEKWQMINFVRDQHGSLYVIGTENSGDTAGDDWARIFLVTGVPGAYTVACVGEKHIYSDKPKDVEMGNLDAIGGMHVSPTGRLSLYIGPHENQKPPWIYFLDTVNGWKDANCDNDNRCYALQFGEFTTGYYYDGIPPVTLHSLAGDTGEHGWFVSNVQVILNANDTCGSGVKQTQYRINNGSWQTYSAPFTLMDGNYTLEYHSQDKKDNWEDVKTISIRIDTAKPSGSIRLNDNANTTPSVAVQVNLTASDVTSGLSQLRLRNAGDTWGAWQTYKENIRWQLPALSGQSHTVEVQFKDRAGLVSDVYSDDILLDIYPDYPRSSSFRLVKSTLGAGGGPSSSVNYQLSATLGQPSMIGESSSQNYDLSAGYWALKWVMDYLEVFLPLALR